MLIRRSRLALVLPLVLVACGQPPVPVEQEPSAASRAPAAHSQTQQAPAELPPGHPPMDAPTETAPALPPGHGGGGGGGDQVSAEEFFFAGTVRITSELHAAQKAAVFLSVRDRATNSLVLSTRHTMDAFAAAGGSFELPFRLDDSNRMMGGTARPRDVRVLVKYSPMGMLPPIGSTEPIEGAVEAGTDATAGVTDLVLSLE